MKKIATVSAAGCLALMSFSSDANAAAFDGANGDELVSMGYAFTTTNTSPPPPNITTIKSDDPEFLGTQAVVDDAVEEWGKFLWGNSADVLDKINASDSSQGCVAGVCSIPIPVSFAYAIVKQANDYYAYKNGGDLSKLQFVAGDWSNVTYFTPIPAALPLLLSAIGGLFGIRWLRRRKAGEAGLA